MFAVVSDLSKHGEWAGNALRVAPLDDSPIGVGKKYRSYANVRGREFHADLMVTEFSPPNVFAFAGNDETGKFSHRFTLEKTENGTRVTRTVRFELSLPQSLFYWVTLRSVRLPAARAALENLQVRFN